MLNVEEKCNVSNFSFSKVVCNFCPYFSEVNDMAAENVVP